MIPQSLKMLIHESGTNYFSWSHIMLWFYDKRLKNYCGLSLKQQVAKFENDNGWWATAPQDWNEIGQAMLTAIKSKKFTSRQIVKDVQKRGAKLFNCIDEIEKENISLLSKERLLYFFNQLWQEMGEINFLGFIPVVSDFEHFFLSNELEQLAAKKIKRYKLSRLAPEYVSILVSHAYKTISNEAEQSLLKITLLIYASLKGAVPTPQRIAEVIRNSSKTRRLFLIHIKRFAWLNYGFQGPTWDEKEFSAVILDILRKNSDLTKHAKKVSAERQRLQFLQRQYILELRLSRSEKLLFTTAQDFLFIKSTRVEMRHRTCYSIDRLFNELVRRHQGHTITDFRYSTVEEIRYFISTDKFPTAKNERDERRKFCVYYQEESACRFLYGQEAKNFWDEAVKTENLNENIFEVKGQAAMIGKVKGVVKIVNRAEDIGKVAEGDILVSIATSPEVLPAMRKASAFVTDQGGITSHAAIVAREMRKPCVIGTKIATKIFKDGDMVEVDATTGVVRKI